MVGNRLWLVAVLFLAFAVMVPSVVSAINATDFVIISDSQDVEYSLGNSNNWVDGTPVVAFADLVSIEYGEGLFIIGGGVGAAPAIIQTSPDGISWTQQTIPLINNDSQITTIKYSPSQDIWMATTNDFKLITSSDGITWTEQILPDPNIYDPFVINDIEYNVANNTWMVVGNSGHYMTSTNNGVNWTYYSLPAYANNNFFSVDYSESQNKWVIVLNDQDLGGMISSDGITWSSISLGGLFNLSYDVVFEESLNLWVTSGEQEIFTSADGITWNNYSSPEFTAGVQSLIYSLTEQVWFSIVQGGGLKKSTDSTAQSWTSITTTKGSSASYIVESSPYTLMVPMSVSSTAPANNTPIVPATTLDFNVDAFGGLNNTCIASIDGSPTSANASVNAGTNGSIDVSAQITPLMDDGLNHTWSVSCTDDAVPANTGTSETRLFSVRDPWGIYECGAITTPNTYVVKNDINGTGDCLIIDADNVDIDLNGFTVWTPTGTGTYAVRGGIPIYGTVNIRTALTILGDTVDNVSVHDGTLRVDSDGTGTANGYPLYVKGDGTDNLYVDNVTLRTPIKTGGYTSLLNLVSNFHLEGINNGLLVENSRFEGTVRSDQDTTRSEAYVQETNNAVFRNNEFNKLYYGILIYTGNNITFDNNTATGGSTDIFLPLRGDFSNFIISNNVLSPGMSYYGDFWSGSHTYTDFVFENNSYSGTPTGTSIFAYTTTTFPGVKMIGNDFAAITLQGATSVDITDNEFYGSFSMDAASSGDVYNNVFNTTETHTIASASINLNTTVGNTWTNPASTGFSDTCTNDWSNVCVEDNIIGSSTDFFPVALSSVVNMTVSATSPVNGTTVGDVNDSFNFSVDVYGGSSNACYLAIDGVAGTSLRLSTGATSYSGGSKVYQAVYATGDMLVGITNPILNGWGTYTPTVKTGGSYGVVVGVCDNTLLSTNGDYVSCNVPIVTGTRYFITFEKYNYSGYWGVGIGPATDPSHEQDSQSYGYGLTMDMFFVNATSVSVSSSGSISASEELATINNDGFDHTWAVSCVDPTTANVGSSVERTFSVLDYSLLPLDASGVSCGATVYPNEDDLPSKAEFGVDFNLFRGLGFTTPLINLTVSRGGHSTSVTEGSCSYVVHDSMNRTYSCNVSAGYWFGAGTYDAQLDVFDVESDSVLSSGICNYGLLLASQRTSDTIGFSDAAPGIGDSQSDAPITIRNTGNVDFNLDLTAYDLVGRSQPSVVLAADNFKVGASFGTAVTLSDGVLEDLSMTVVASEGAEDDMWFWLSMPSGQVIQDYYAPTAWTVGTS